MFVVWNPDLYLSTHVFLTCVESSLIFLLLLVQWSSLQPKRVALVWNLSKQMSRIMLGFPLNG